jgi:hypothetical protein
MTPALVLCACLLLHQVARDLATAPDRHPNPQDRRPVLITLTPEGQALVPRLAPVFGRVTTLLFNGFSPAEVSALTTMLERMRSNVTATATTRRPDRDKPHLGSAPSHSLIA